MYWLIGNVINCTVVDYYPIVTLLTLAGERKRFTFSRENSALIEFIQQLAEERAEAAFYFSGKPGERTHATEFVLPHIGRPRLASNSEEAGDFVFEFEGSSSPFFIRQNPPPLATSSPEDQKKIILQAIKTGQAVAVLIEDHERDVLDCVLFGPRNAAPPFFFLPAEKTLSTTAQGIDLAEATRWMQYLATFTCREGVPHCPDRPSPIGHCTDCLPYNYPDMGCEDRAYLASYLLLQNEQDFPLAADHLLVLALLDHRIETCSENKPRNRKVKWNGHVTLAAQGANGNRIILDPAVFKIPATIDEWLTRLRVGTNVVITELRFAPHTEERLALARGNLKSIKRDLDKRVKEFNKWPPYFPPCNPNGTSGGAGSFPLPAPLPA